MPQNKVQFTYLPWYTYLDSLLKTNRVVITTVLMTTTRQAEKRPDCGTGVTIAKEEEKKI
jgi:hypothetical protein